MASVLLSSYSNYVKLMSAYNLRTACIAPDIQGTISGALVRGSFERTSRTAANSQLKNLPQPNYLNHETALPHDSFRILSLIKLNKVLRILNLIII
jgi:hypothetical protein